MAQLFVTICLLQYGGLCIFYSCGPTGIQDAAMRSLADGGLSVLFLTAGLENYSALTSTSALMPYKAEQLTRKTMVNGAGRAGRRALPSKRYPNASNFTRRVRAAPWFCMYNFMYFFADTTPCRYSLPLLRCYLLPELVSSLLWAAWAVMAVRLTNIT